MRDLTNERVQITARQFYAARAIGSSLGHHWAQVLLDWPIQDWDPEHLAQVCAAAHGAQMSSHSCILPDRKGVVRDHTGSRRLVWEVHPDGMVVLDVERPLHGGSLYSVEGQVVLRAVLNPSVIGLEAVLARLAGAVEYQLTDLVVLAPGWCERHLAALEQLLDVFLDGELVDRELCRLREQQRVEAEVAPEYLWIVQDRLEGVRQRPHRHGGSPSPRPY